MKITKRFIALILCAIMMLSVTTGAFAQTDETDGEDSTIVVNETESEIETEEEEKSDSEESEGVLCSCILEEGEHQEGCQHYVALEKNSLYENLMSYTVFEEFYTAFLQSLQCRLKNEYCLQVKLRLLMFFSVDFCILCLP